MSITDDTKNMDFLFRVIALQRQVIEKKTNEELCNIMLRLKQDLEKIKWNTGLK